jgi:hypothetical protein
MPDYDGRTPLRPLYLARDFVDWVNDTPELDEEDWSDRTGGRTRFEHLDQMLADFRCDLRPLVGDLNRVQPTKKGVWSMHCPGVRVFGWAPDQFSLVAVTAAFAENTHGKGSIVGQKTADVLDFIKTNGLSETVQYGERSGLFQQKT